MPTGRMQRLVALLQVLCILAAGVCRGREYVINEQFDDLAGWEPITFPKIDRHSEYSIGEMDGGSVLVARSDNSASGIRNTREFNVYAYPVVRWRWKINNVYAKGNVEEKSGDDYPIRVYVMFRYDPEKASFGESIQYGLAKALYGAYPPKSSLNYIWANRPHAKRIYPSPYTDRAQLVILRTGNREAGMWVEEEINIIEDYEEAFGMQPPDNAAIAIMNDSDNTGGAAESYMDYIQVLRSE